MLPKLVRAVGLIIITGAVCWLLWWLVGFIGLPQPFNKIAMGVIAVGAVFVLTGILMDLGGYPPSSYLGKSA
jgi:hypothetical protein